MISVKLPNNKILKCSPTGKRKKLQNLLDGSLFMFDNQIWEKLPCSCANLSDLNDGSEVSPLEYVELYEEIK